MRLMTFIESKTFVLILVLVLPALLPLQAQINTATLSGIVTDQSGAVVPNAQVQLTSLSTGSLNNTICGPNGEYTITNLEATHYKFVVTVSGFQRFEVSDLLLEVGQKATENVTLQIGTTTQQVVVSAAAPVFTNCCFCRLWGQRSEGRL